MSSAHPAEDVGTRRAVEDLDLIRRALIAHGILMPGVLGRLQQFICDTARQQPPPTSFHDDDAHAGLVAPLLLSLPTVSRLLGVSVRTTERLVANKELPTVRVGSRRLVSPDDLMAFVDCLRADITSPNEETQ